MAKDMSHTTVSAAMPLHPCYVRYHFNVVEYDCTNVRNHGRLRHQPNTVRVHALVKLVLRFHAPSGCFRRPTQNVACLA